MAIERDPDAERAARIDHILEELRLNTEDLHELAKRVTEQSRRVKREARGAVKTARIVRGTRKAGKKR